MCKLKVILKLINCRQLGKELENLQVYYRSKGMGMCSRSTFNKVFAVAILTAINFLNYMDRYTIAGTAEFLVT